MKEMHLTEEEYYKNVPENFKPFVEPYCKQFSHFPIELVKNTKSEYLWKVIYLDESSDSVHFDRVMYFWAYKPEQAACKYFQYTDEVAEAEQLAFDLSLLNISLVTVDNPSEPFQVNISLEEMKNLCKKYNLELFGLCLS